MFKFNVGKLGERNLRTQTTLIFNPKQLYTFLAMPDVEVSSPLFVSDHAVWISWQHAEEMHAPILKHTNVVITSYVTAGAGIHLYSYLNKLQEKALYCDTDSVVYVQPSGEPGPVETGDCLGAITSELKSGQYICEFVSTGPKHYAYKTFNTVIGEQTSV